MKYTIHYDITRFSELDIYLFKEGTHTKLYKHFGAHFMEREGIKGVYFALWAPNANNVSIRADFNNYDTTSHFLKKRDDESGIYECFIENVLIGTTYKYHIHTDTPNANADKADPFAFYAEKAPASASKVHSLAQYKFNDKSWMKKRHKYNSHKAAISIYEVHLGSWKRKIEEENRYLSYVEAAQELALYVKKMNFTKEEFMLKWD